MYYCSTVFLLLISHSSYHIHAYASDSSRITGVFATHDPDGSLRIISSSSGGSIRVRDHASKSILFHLDIPHRSVFALDATRNIARTIGGPFVVHCQLANNYKFSFVKV